MMIQNREMLLKYMYIAFVVAIYWVVSILMVFINKLLLSGNKIHLDAPLFITWCQCITCILICLSIKGLSNIFPQYFYFPNGNPFCGKTFKKLLPLSVLFTGMIVTNNLCLKYVGVAFYYIGRSLTTVFNVIFTYMILGEKTSFKVILCCIVIIFGFWLGVDQEQVAGSFSLKGTIFGVLASMVLSLYSIETKKVLPHVNQEIWLLSYYNNIYSAVLFLPLIYLNGEVRVLSEYDKLGDFDFWSAMIMGGVCGFMIGYVSMLQIKVTSPLTHNISGTAKACAQTVLATHWYNESKPLLWWLSNAIVLLASAAYARVKQLSMQKAHNEQSLISKT